MVRLYGKKREAAKLAAFPILQHYSRVCEQQLELDLQDYQPESSWLHEFCRQFKVALTDMITTYWTMFDDELDSDDNTEMADAPKPPAFPVKKSEKQKLYFIAGYIWLKLLNNVSKFRSDIPDVDAVFAFVKGALYPTEANIPSELEEVAKFTMHESRGRLLFVKADVYDLILRLEKESRDKYYRDMAEKAARIKKKSKGKKTPKTSTKL